MQTGIARYPASAVDAPWKQEAMDRPDMLGPRSPDGLRVIQITTDPSQVHSHVYMEAPIFTSDSRRFIFRQVRNPRETEPMLIRHDYCICDVHNGYAFRRITDEEGAMAPVVTPDGRFMYYLMDEAREPNCGRLVLRRVSLDTFRRETVLVIDTPPHGTSFLPSRCEPLASISSDGAKICTAAYFGDGERPHGPYGVLVIDLARACAEVVITGEYLCNVHPQYCRSRDPELKQLIMIQENHGQFARADGLMDRTVAPDALGADLHVMRDDGTDVRDLPFGRDEQEQITGHQCWRGHTQAVVAGVGRKTSGGDFVPVVQGVTSTKNDKYLHLGRHAPGTRRDEVCRELGLASFAHFVFDDAGELFISDMMNGQSVETAEDEWAKWRNPHLVVGRILEEPQPRLVTQYLIDTGASFSLRDQQTHAHPFLSPDGQRAFFNSDMTTGQSQIYALEGVKVAAPVDKTKE